MAEKQCNLLKNGGGMKTSPTKTLTVTKHASITNYAGASYVDGWIHFNGLFVVNATIPANSTLFTISGTTLSNAGFPFIQIEGSHNNWGSLLASTGIVSNPQQQLATGTYMVDAWFKGTKKYS